MMDEQKNLAAWECLDQALFTSSHVKAKDMEKGSTDWDNVYPVSKEETDKMKDLVDEAVRKADDPSDSFFRERVADLREIISYSYSKHRTWKWSLIFGSIIAACIFWYFGNQDKEDAQKYAKDVTLVENWKKADTTITYDKLDASSELSYQLYERRVQSANAYKFGLMIAGVLIFCFVSVLIMTIETISGLKRNFNWAAMLNKGKKAPVAVAEAPINARND